MSPLLEIRSIPIEFRVTRKDASLEYTSGTVEMEISRSANGNVNMKSGPVRIPRQDSFESRSSDNSMARDSGAAAAAVRSSAPSAPSAPVASSSAVAQMAQYSYQATSVSYSEGQISIDGQLSAVPASQEEGTGFTPAEAFSGGGEDWDGAAVNIRYNMEKLKFKWNFEEGTSTFTPADVEVEMTQRPEVKIKYIGGPIYVPKSSDPNYRPVDVHA